MRIILPEALRELTGGRGVVELVGTAKVAGGAAVAGGTAVTGGAAVGSPGMVDDTPGTVGGILGELRVAHPGLYDRLVTEQGLLRPHVNIFVDGENIRFTGGLETAVAAGSEVFVLPAISGG